MSSSAADRLDDPSGTFAIRAGDQSYSARAAACGADIFAGSWGPRRRVVAGPRLTGRGCCAAWWGSLLVGRLTRALGRFACRSPGVRRHGSSSERFTMTGQPIGGCDGCRRVGGGTVRKGYGPALRHARQGGELMLGRGAWFAGSKGPIAWEVRGSPQVAGRERWLPSGRKFPAPCYLVNSAYGQFAHYAPSEANPMPRVARSGAQDDQKAELGFAADRKGSSPLHPRGEPAAAPWRVGAAIGPCGSIRRRRDCCLARPAPPRQRVRFCDRGTGPGRLATASACAGPRRGIDFELVSPVAGNPPAAENERCSRVERRRG